MTEEHARLSAADAVVVVEVAERIGTVTLNRPEARNALSSEVLRQLPRAMAALDADDDVDVVILTGRDPAFCAGLDLKELGSTGGNLGAGAPAPGQDRPVDQPVRRGPWAPMAKPVIGAVNGVAVTGGFEVALCCDFLVASERARFADTHARVGVMPGWGLTVLLPQAIGLRRAREMSLTGNFMTAEEALHFGLVNHVVAHDELLPTARRLAADIAGNDQPGVRRVLATYAAVADGTLAEGWATEARMGREWLAGRDVTSAVATPTGGNHATRKEPDRMIVETPLGKLEGVVSEGGIARFAGIPYAAPPVGPNRFRPPRPPEPWTGVRPAQEFGTVSRQLASPLDALFGSQPEPQDEDCLFLNVWTPGCDGSRRPVMVWIHGGAFIQGSGSGQLYHGEQLAARGDVVVVTLNYRLGELGFLHIEGRGEDGRSTGNNGILDQVAALRWVRENIAAFGGDSGRVTIFGESAGGMSVSALLGLPEAKGLFHRAISQSGAANGRITLDHARDVAERYRTELELESVAELADAPIDDLLKVQALLTAEAFGDLDGALDPDPGASLTFGPVVDGVTLPEDPLSRVAGGAAADVSLLVGANRDEWNLFGLLDTSTPDEESVAAVVSKILPGIDPAELLATYREDRPELEGKALKGAVITDHVFGVPAVRLAEAQSAHRPHDTWMYLFTWPSGAMGGALGSCHALELPFVFGALELEGLELFLGSDGGPADLSEAMMDAWLAFARSGNPAHPGLPEWPSYGPEQRAVMEFGTERRLLDDPGGHAHRTWPH